MQETTFEVRIPASLLEFGLDQDQIQRQVNQWLVFTLFTEGHISSGKAASLLDLTRLEFLALLGKHGIAYVDYSPQEIADELKAVDSLNIESSE